MSKKTISANYLVYRSLTLIFIINIIIISSYLYVSFNKIIIISIFENHKNWITILWTTASFNKKK